MTLQLYVPVTLCKNQKNYMHLFFKKLEKPHFEPILGPLHSKGPKQDFFSKTLKTSVGGSREKL